MHFLKLRMTDITRPAWIAALSAIVLIMSGCGGSAPTETGIEGTVEFQGLKNLGEMYRIVSTRAKRPPKDIDELRKAEDEVPGGFASLGEGNVAIFFGVSLPEPATSGGEAGQTVLAYERLAPSQGGLVLYLDGNVKSLTPAEFKEAKKAGTKAWVAPAGS
jgi:hypothetical protein